MINLRKYGNEPYKIAVIHGGPGAPGSMGKVANELSKVFGVLEPMQSADSIEGQILELKNTLEKHGSPKVTLIGHSWGAWLSYIFAARYPEFVKKLILVSSGSYEEEYVASMDNKRVNRLSEEENSRASILFQKLNDNSLVNKKEVLSEFGKLMSKADSYAPISIESDDLDFQPEVFKNCMKEINELRSSKKLLNIGKDIKCPVVAIHGEYDSHSPEGVEKPLSKVIKDFKFILLKDCGHTPWNEIYAKDKFFEMLFMEVNHV